MTIQEYNNSQTPETKVICDRLMQQISHGLPEAESKIWHGHPVWFLDGNPIVGYSLEKKGLRLMFWSGESFEETQLMTGTGKFKDASIFYNNSSEIDTTNLSRWLEKAQNIQWDYKNIVKRKGVLERLK
jgi:uncharacterized protein YdhG (YjbR/CyaY superfamily)